MSPEILTMLGIGVALAGLILNGQRSLNTRMDRLEARMDRLETRMDRLDDTIRSLSDRVARLEGGFAVFGPSRLPAGEPEPAG